MIEEIDFGNGVTATFDEEDDMLDINCGDGTAIAFDELMFCRLQAFADRHWGKPNKHGRHDK